MVYDIYKVWPFIIVSIYIYIYYDNMAICTHQYM